MEPQPQTQPQTPGLPAALPTARYTRHRPEATLLYELIGQHYPPFLAALEQDGRTLPTFVQQEFAAYLKCGRLEHGFRESLRRCEDSHLAVLLATCCPRIATLPAPVIRPEGKRRPAARAALRQISTSELSGLGAWACHSTSNMSVACRPEQVKRPPRFAATCPHQGRDAPSTGSVSTVGRA